MGAPTGLARGESACSAQAHTEEANSAEVEGGGDNNNGGDDDDQLASLPTELCGACAGTGAPETAAHLVGWQSGSSKGATTAALARQFNRLDPNRRSFSNPAVNLAASSTATAACAASSAALATRSSYKWRRQQHQAAAAATAAVAAAATTTTTTATTTTAMPMVQAAAAATSRPKLRRRTALGLISFGSAHLRPFALGLAAGDSQQAQQPPPPPARPQTNWRAWLLGKSASVGGQAEPIQAKEENASQKQVDSGGCGGNVDKRQQQQQQQGANGSLLLRNSSQQRQRQAAATSATPQTPDGKLSFCCCRWRASERVREEQGKVAADWPALASLD